jgi:hypothetical protein
MVSARRSNTARCQATVSAPIMPQFRNPPRSPDLTPLDAYLWGILKVITGTLFLTSLFNWKATSVGLRQQYETHFRRCLKIWERNKKVILNLVEVLLSMILRTPRSVHVGFVVDKVALEQVFFSEFFRLPCQYYFTMALHTHISSGDEQ